jgi:chaperonin cofactor prefoldin
MVARKVELLKKKIAKILELVKGLKDENSRLVARNRQLEAMLKERDEAPSGLEKEGQGLVVLKDDYDLLQIENYEMKQDKESVETRIDEILSEISSLLSDGDWLFSTENMEQQKEKKAGDGEEASHG